MTTITMATPHTPDDFLISIDEKVPAHLIVILSPLDQLSGRQVPQVAQVRLDHNGCHTRVTRDRLHLLTLTVHLQLRERRGVM